MSDGTQDKRPTPDLPALLQKAFDTHRQAAERLDSTPVDQISTKAELSSLHRAVAFLADALRVGGASQASGHKAAARLELTKIRAAHLYEEARAAERAVIEFAQIGLRTLLLANGGALIGLLTFIGNFRAFPNAAESLWWSFGFFVGGLFLTLLALILAYLTQSEVSASETAGAEKIYFHQFEDHSEITAEKSEDEKKHIRRAKWYRFPAIGAALLSAVAFALGSGFGVNALSSTSQPLDPPAGVSATPPLP